MVPVWATMGGHKKTIGGPMAHPIAYASKPATSPNCFESVCSDRLSSNPFFLVSSTRTRFRSNRSRLIPAVLGSVTFAAALLESVVSAAVLVATAVQEPVVFVAFAVADLCCHPRRTGRPREPLLYSRTTSRRTCATSNRASGPSRRTATSSNRVTAPSNRATAPSGGYSAGSI